MDSMRVDMGAQASISTATRCSYRIDNRMNYYCSGIASVKNSTQEKLQWQLVRRYSEHWRKKTSVKEHLDTCDPRPIAGKVKI